MRAFQPTVIELHDLVREPTDGAVVGRHDERDAGIDQGAHAVHHEPPGFGVELGGRLVGHHDRGARDHRLGERRPLLLSSGELVGEVVDAVADAEPFEDLGVAPHRRTGPRRVADARRS